VLAVPLPKLNKCENLFLDFYFNNLSTPGVEAISAGLAPLTQLKKLHLSYDFNHMLNEGGEAVGESLKGMTLMEELYLNVGTRNFGYPGFTDICKAIENMPELKSLVIKLPTNKVGVIGARDLVSLFSKLTKLEVISVDFKEEYIGNPNAGVMKEIVNAAVKNNKNLREFDFSLAFNDIKDFGSVEAIEAFTKFHNMERLRFDLSTNEISDEYARKVIKIAEKIAK